MKKSIIRLMVCALSCVVALFVFSSCKGSDGEKNNGSPGGEITAPADPVVAKYTVIFIQNSETQTTVEVEEGKSPDASKIPALTPKEGYDAAWSVTDFSVYKGGDVVQCFAVYQPKEYEVSYNVNGGVEITQTTKVRYQSEYLLVTPERDGYIFSHWTDASGNKVPLSGAAWRVAQNVTLTAQWTQKTANTYRITFQQEGAEDVVYYVNEGESFTQPLPVLVAKTGYTAVWSVNGSAPDFTNISSNLYVTPKYTAKTYTVSFDSNGGSAVTDTRVVTYGEAYDFSDIEVTKAGLSFVNGWYYADRNVLTTGIWEIDGDDAITLTAKWSVKVTFRQSGCEDIVRYYFEGSSVPKEEIPAVTPKDGYIVKWEAAAEEKLKNLQGDVVIDAIEQETTWSPKA